MNRNVWLIILIAAVSLLQFACSEDDGKCAKDDYSCLSECDEDNSCYSERTLSEWEACMKKHCTNESHLGDLFGQYKDR